MSKTESKKMKTEQETVGGTKVAEAITKLAGSPVQAGVKPRMGLQRDSDAYTPASPAEADVQEIGKKIIVGHVAVAVMYIELCKLIRTDRIDPVTVRKLLLPLGFQKSRVSEINTVANAADEQWRQIEAAGIGFKRAIDLARMPRALQEKAAKTLGVPMSEIVSPATLPPDTGGTPEGEGEVPAAQKAAMWFSDRVAKAMAAVANLCWNEFNADGGGVRGFKKLVFCDRGFTVTVTYKEGKAAVRTVAAGDSK